MTIRATILRHWQLLRLLPRYPQKITAQELKQALAVHGFDTTERTVQRDLMDLSSAFPLVVDERAKPYGWSWQREARSFDLPGLSVAEALTWVLAEQHLRSLLPAGIVEHLQPQFQAARSRLSAEQQPTPARSWLDKVRTVPPAQPLTPPQVAHEVQRTVSDALMRERQLDISYRKKGSKSAESYRIHPLAIIQRGWVIYLHARIGDYPNAQNFALHRVEAATLREEPAVAPPGYDLDAGIERGIWAFGKGQLLQVALRFSREAGEHLLETPLSTDQSVSDEGGTLLVHATVADTPQLRWWLLGFGDTVEVLSPTALRREMSDVAARMARKYASGAMMDSSAALAQRA
ncbi:helix-turn-helix transcriptional regulator [Thauera sedimentorum]|uniref:helix-turn-helix transcriptional regulator n=1 Tax=Thauera sedimentorum TaxID=2767595 RepID=UPI001CA6D783